MRAKRIFLCAVAAVFIAATGAPARAQETWDETLKNTLSSWWSSARDTARIVTLSPVTINMCWASDKHSFAGDPAVLGGSRKIRDVQGSVQKLKMMRLGIVHNPNPILVKAVLAAVTAPATQ